MNYAKTQTDAMPWLCKRFEKWELGQQRRLVYWTVDELMTPSPEWYARDMEYQYRKGFLYAVAECSAITCMLYKKGGYVRPVEIANILANWTEELRKWKRSSAKETPLKTFGEPVLKWESWPSIKRKVHERDGWSCSICASSKRLHAHHIESVSEGGLPELSNLTTLCESCHNAAHGHAEESMFLLA